MRITDELTDGYTEDTEENNFRKPNQKGVRTMATGILGDLFDFNSNGDLDIIEQAAKFAILQEMMANDDVENENVSTATLQLRTTD